MRVKYIIHRSKAPFAKQKEVFRKIIHFYGKQYPGLRFVDKGLRYSAVYQDLSVDFDFGYLNMRYRDFSGYDRVIAQSSFTVLNPELNPGDIAFPVKSDMMRINSSGSKVRVYSRSAQFNNCMNTVWDDLRAWEGKENVSKAQQFVAAELSPDSKGTPGTLADFHVKKDAKFVESNTFFYPSHLTDASSLLKAGEERLPIRNLQEHLEGRFDGVNCEAKQMIENVSDRMMMYAIALDKPYHGKEPAREARYGTDLEQVVPSYNDAQVNYFLTQLFGYLMDKQFQV